MQRTAHARRARVGRQDRRDPGARSASASLRAPVSFARPTPPEYLIKAAYLYHFAMFVDWPAEAFPSRNAPIVIGIVGADPFGPAIDDTVRDKRIDGRPLVVKRLDWAQDLRHCHILFVADGSRIADVVRRVGNLSVLIVGESQDLAQAGRRHHLQDRGQSRPLRHQRRRREAQPPDDQLQAVEPCTDCPQSVTPDQHSDETMTPMSFRTLSIKGKLMLITMLTSSVALLRCVGGIPRLRPGRVPRPHEPGPDDRGADHRREQRGGRSPSTTSAAASEILAALKARDETVVGGPVYAKRGTLCLTICGTATASRAAAVARQRLSVREPPSRSVPGSRAARGGARHVCRSCPTCSTGMRASSAIRPSSSS